MKPLRRSYSLIKYGFVSLMVVHIVLNYARKRDGSHAIKFNSSLPSSSGKSIREKALETFSVAYNGTHLWSMHLADDEYYRIAQTAQCRTVTYTVRNKTKNIRIYFRV